MRCRGRPVVEREVDPQLFGQAFAFESVWRRRARGVAHGRERGMVELAGAAGRHDAYVGHRAVPIDEADECASGGCPDKDGKAMQFSDGKNCF